MAENSEQNIRETTFIYSGIFCKASLMKLRKSARRAFRAIFNTC